MSFFGELARLAILAQQAGGGGNAPAGGQPGAGGPPAAGQPGGPANAPGSGGILEIILGPAGMMVFLIALFWLMIIRPQQQRESDHEKMLDELKIYDKVITIGGILGTIIDIRKGDDVVTLRIDDKTGTEIRVLKSHISREEVDDEKKDNEKDSEKKDA